MTVRIASRVTTRFLEMWANRYTRYNIIIIAVLSVVGFFWVYPFLWAISGAFKTQLGLFTSGASLIPDKLDLSNFQRAWVTAGFNTYFANSVLYSVAATLVELVKSALCGYVLARYRFPGRTILLGLILATLFIPLGTIILPQFLLIENLGLLNTQAGVILALSGAAGAFYVLMFMNFFSSIPEELFDAAKVDGAGFFAVFRLVLPLARPIIATVVIFEFIRTWNDFNIPLIYTFSAPQLRTLAVGMFAFQGENSFDLTGFAAGTVISFIPILLVFLCFQGYFVRGLSGAVKE